MGKYSEAALGYRRIEPHHNCAQSVMCAFCELTGIDHDKAMSITAQYGGGKKLTCGAVLGARAVINYISGLKNEEDPAYINDKNAELFKRLHADFIAKNKSDLCKEIKDNGYRSCDGCVEDAAAMVEKMLENGEVK